MLVGENLLPHLEHLHFDHIVATCRYEDDLVAFSYSLCKDCLDFVILELYKSIIKIEESNDHLEVSSDQDIVCIHQKFLDMRLTFNFNRIQFDLFHHNLHFALGHDLDTQTRFRFPPPIGCVDTILKRLQMNIMSRRSRWCQLELSVERASVCTVIDTAELLRLGYDARIIKKAWHATSGPDPYFALSLRIMYLTLQSKPTSSCPWHVSQLCRQVISCAHSILLPGSRPSA